MKDMFSDICNGDLSTIFSSSGIGAQCNTGDISLGSVLAIYLLFSGIRVKTVFYKANPVSYGVEMFMIHGLTLKLIQYSPPYRVYLFRTTGGWGKGHKYEFVEMFVEPAPALFLIYL